jgi:Aromatic acid exporter family member 1
VPNWWRSRLNREFLRLKNDGRAAVLWSLRITVAAVASYVVATLFFPGTQPLLAPLTAMLVVQVTPVSLLASGIDRVVSVVAGVLVAVAFALVVPLEWWSLGLLILVSITIGQALRLRANLIEVAISGMLVLGVGTLNAESAAWQRIAETLVGAAVGVAANLLFPPKVATADAGRAIYGLAASVGELLRRAAKELDEHVGEDRELASAAEAWLGDARRITYDIPPIGAVLVQAEEGRRLNVRALGTADVGPGLRQGLEALEHSAVAIRGMFRGVLDATREARWLDDESAEDVLLGLAQTFRELAAAIETFGQLVQGEAGPTRTVGVAHVQALREALDGLQEARARLDDLLMSDSDSQLLELHAAVLSTVKRLMREMDLDERIRRQLRLLRPARPRPPFVGGAPTENDRPSEAPMITPDDETQLMPKIPGNRWNKPRP